MDELATELAIKNARLEAALNLLTQMAERDKKRRASHEAMLAEPELNMVLCVAGLPEIE